VHANIIPGDLFSVPELGSKKKAEKRLFTKTIGFMKHHLENDLGELLD